MSIAGQPKLLEVTIVNSAVWVVIEMGHRVNVWDSGHVLFVSLFLFWVWVTWVCSICKNASSFKLDCMSMILQ